MQKLAMLGAMVLTAISISCGTNDSDNNHQEVNTPGLATILSMVDGDPDQGCPNDPVEVQFEFAPTDPNARRNYLYPNVSDTGYIKIQTLADPSRGWLLEEGLTVGTTHPCVREERRWKSPTLPGGSPVEFRFVEVDYAKGDDSCFAE